MKNIYVILIRGLNLSQKEMRDEDIKCGCSMLQFS